jgi:hypothetical protein
VWHYSCCGQLRGLGLLGGTEHLPDDGRENTTVLWGREQATSQMKRRGRDEEKEEEKT